MDWKKQIIPNKQKKNLWEKFLKFQNLCNEEEKHLWRKTRNKKKMCTQSGEDACERQLASLFGTQENKIETKHENTRQNLVTTNFGGFPSLTQCYFPLSHIHSLFHPLAPCFNQTWEKNSLNPPTLHITILLMNITIHLVAFHVPFKRFLNSWNIEPLSWHF